MGLKGKKVIFVYLIGFYTNEINTYTWRLREVFALKDIRAGRYLNKEEIGLGFFPVY